MTSTPPRSPPSIPTPLRTSPPHRHRKPFVKSPSLDLGSIDEDSEYDSGHLNLGAESPSPGTPGLFQDSAYVQQWAAAGRVPSRIPSRRPSSRMLRDRVTLNKNKDSVDRDCGICFEYAVMPCRTLCCGKLFCTEHLRDWLHGPNAEGLCPNCENPCSLQGGTLSLAPPLSSRPKTPITYAPSPLVALQAHHNDTLDKEKADVLTGMPSLRKATASNASDSASTSSGLQSVNTSEDETSPQLPAYALKKSPSSCGEKAGTFTPARSMQNKLAMATGAGGGGTAPAAAQTGAIRLISIVTFLLFLYKLLS
ncbi:hypothetical protein D9619_012633 [Psilocybe cf. subviscida]|uniref:RING-type domain-containing protein n=1 Tax=Psilocybe cf. subviscida TaxID=2480587 RepID=A0A8H5EZA8_9AGAR|nr:hypothetical protein D9619_012633 [Psilocybe cf. subviscida]